MILLLVWRASICSGDVAEVLFLCIVTAVESTYIMKMPNNINSDMREAYLIHLL